MTYSVDHDRRALADICQSYSAFIPPRRVTVCEGAQENLYFKKPGDVPGPWSADETPYMVEPMNMLASRRHESVVFVGPARTGKTAALLLGWMSHVVVNDPGDMLMLQMTQDKAREFSRTDIDRAIEHSPTLYSRMGGKQDDNTHDKMFRNGMWLRIGWPTKSNVASSTYRYVAITDLDRMTNAENVDGEGPLFDLARKRTQTFGTRGMCLVESSPGIELVDPNWVPASAHEAPPATGILGIYNLSDRRRFYWQCPMCQHWFEPKPGIELFGLPSDEVLLDTVREADLEALATEYNRVICPHCQAKIGPRSKYELNRRGRWLQDGLSLTKSGEVRGKAHESTIAGYWMGGIPATYQSWRSILLRHLQGLRAYALTGSEETLKTTTNTDQGMPYMSRLLLDAKRNATDPSSRKEASMQRYVMPDQARFLVATVDVQGGMNSRFVVQVHAIGPHREKWLVDRYAITESNREGMGAEKAPIDPAKYAEDWDLITERVSRSTYRTNVDGVEMRVKLTVVDSGGEEGVTAMAYAWFRRVRTMGFSSRIMLVKGVGRDQKATFPFIKETWVGGRNPNEKGDIPLYLINTNTLKDTVTAGIRRPTPGPGYFHIPGWVSQAFIDELNSEVRMPNGTWKQIRKRNEAFDLLVYCEAGCLRLGADRIKWDEIVPEWARMVHENSERISRDERREMQDNEQIAEVPVAASSPVAQAEARPARRAARERVIRSRYLA
jgi:phage terminase large subunit GpA-like protein